MTPLNGDPLDCRKANLVFVTRSAAKHLAKKFGTSSVFKGVSREANGRWRADIKKDGKKYALGRFSSEEEAARAYDKKALELFGKDAKLNFPEQR